MQREHPGARRLAGHRALGATTGPRAHRRRQVTIASPSAGALPRTRQLGGRQHKCAFSSSSSSVSCSSSPPAPLFPFSRRTKLLMRRPRCTAEATPFPVFDTRPAEERTVPVGPLFERPAARRAHVGAIKPRARGPRATRVARGNRQRPTRATGGLTAPPHERGLLPRRRRSNRRTGHMGWVACATAL